MVIRRAFAPWEASIMHPTRNPLPQKIRAAAIDELMPLLADAVDLHTQIKQAHWTIKGPNFIGLHELFDKIADKANEWGDLIAERIAQLGGQAIGTARAAAKNSRLPEYPVNAVKSVDHVRLVSERLGAFSAGIHEAIDATDDAGDATTADMLTGICEELDKYLWFVESHSPKFG
jgi:starvation-inducible DNA-binding protein